MSSEDYCKQNASASQSSFYYSFFFLTPEKRRAITALYAFCRAVDDIVDECAAPDAAARQLDEWRNEIARLYDGRPEHPIMRALFPFLAKYRLPQVHFHEIVDGMEMDLRMDMAKGRYPDFAALSLYCYRVAGAVGLLAAEIFGLTVDKTRDYAKTLGTALQLTNIIRDIAEDAVRGRIYLPQDELRQFGMTENDIFDSRDSESFRRLLAFQIGRAETYYASAMDALPAADRKAQRPGLVMAAIYRATLDRIKRDPGRVLKRRVSLPKGKKLWIALSAALSA